MSRNFRVRAAVTGGRSTGGPLYGIAGAVCDGTCARSAGFLSSLIAPPLVERCAGDCIPRVDASRVNQRDEPVVCVLLAGSCAGARANSVSIPAVRQRRDAISARRVMKAERRTFFIFMADHLRTRTTNRLPAGHVRRRTYYIVSAQPTGCIFLRSARQNFYSKEA